MRVAPNLMMSATSIGSKTSLSVTLRELPSRAVTHRLTGMEPSLSYIGMTTARGPARTFGLRQADRRQHLYALGQTGTGKSTLIETLITQDITAGRGVILLDPHGDLADRVARRHADRVLAFDVATAPGRYGYNPLKAVAAAVIPLAVSGLIETFHHHFGDKAWGPRMEHIFRNVLYALIETGQATLSDVLRMLSEKGFRQQVGERSRNPQVRYFFTDELPKLWGRTYFEAIAPVQSKVGAFLTDPALRRTLVDFEMPISFRGAMDQGQCIIVNLARGILGSDTSAIIGSLMVSTITLAALSRQAMPEAKRAPCHLYLDEFEYFLTPGTATMLSEVRKVGLCVTLANQYLAQLDPLRQAAVLGNVGSQLCFRVGPDDAGIMAARFGLAPHEVSGLQTLPNHHFIASIMIDGTPSPAFSGQVIKSP